MKQKVNFLVEQYGQSLSSIADQLGLTHEEQVNITYALINNALRNSFFKSTSESSAYMSDFTQVIAYLSQYELDTITIRDIIVKSPQILLYSARLDDIYLIFKGNEYKSYVLVDDDDYRCYRKDGVDYSHIISASNKMGQSHMNISQQEIEMDDPYHMETILATIDRRDISEYFNIGENDSVKDILEKLKTGYSKKNYYVKGLPKTENKSK